MIQWNLKRRREMIDDGDYKLIEIYDYKYYTIQIPSDPWN